jgi:hypothetical protein
MREHQMGEECSTYGLEERYIPGFGGKIEEMNFLEDVVVDGRITLKLILRVQGGMTWIGLICLYRRANGEL